MAYVLLTIKIDPKTKADIKNLAFELGLPMSRLVRMLIHQSVKQDRFILIKEQQPKRSHGQLFKITDYYD